MIDWKKTETKYGHNSLSGLQGIKRPTVVCRCSKCGKEKDIKLRTKKEIIWTCPSCIGHARSKAISEQLKENWADTNYRKNQLEKKNEKQYKENQSTLSKTRWSTAEYRTKLETGINTNKITNSTFNILQYTNWKTPLTANCPNCNNTFKITPQKHFENQYCSICHQSKAQKEISEWLKSEYIEHITNDWLQLKSKELDIYIPSHNIAIEYHGLYWHSYGKKETTSDRQRHQEKAIICYKKGIKLYQIFEHEWQHQKPLLKSMILHNFKTANKLDARKTQFRAVNQTEARRFFNQNHIQGHRSSKFIYGLYHNDSLITAMSFNRVRENEYEIMRLATKIDHIIRGGASKLLSAFIQEVKPTKIHTFADLRFSHGIVYERLGFKKTMITAPGYFYYNPSTYEILSRQKCQKHKLCKMLPIFDSQLTESENMFLNGYRRIWTAGNLKYLKII